MHHRVFPRASGNENFSVVHCAHDSATEIKLGPRSDDCNYEVALRVENLVGPSPWSISSEGRTDKVPSAECDIIDFFHKNRDTLSKAPTTLDPKSGDVPARTPWDMEAAGGGGRGKETLFPGLTELSRCYSTVERFKRKFPSVSWTSPLSTNVTCRPHPLSEELTKTALLHDPTSIIG